MNDIIQEKLTLLPENSGVYLLKDTLGDVIYVGKAKSLKNRVKSYFQGEARSPKIEIMVPKIEDLDYITTLNEYEALVLEDILIKRYQPKYNTLLKDDKKFPWIEITDEDYPRILVTRTPSKKKRNNKSKYFGPYVNVKALYATLNFLKEIFPLKQCRQPVYKNKPCINYHIKRCLGPCQQMVTPEEYQNVLKQVELFLTGKQKELENRLNELMQRASETLEYEKAAKYRDTLKAISSVTSSQVIVSNNETIEKDVFAYSYDDNILALVMLRVREGKLVYKESYELTLGSHGSPEEAFWKFLEHYYSAIDKELIPKDIVLPYKSEDSDLLSEIINEKKGKKVKLLLHKNKKGNELYDLALNNSLIALENFKNLKIRKIENDWDNTAIILQNKLNLSKTPHKIECFDISHLSGTDTVASLVVFKNGKPLKSEYRKFKIRNNEGKIDDFASMKEVITRRYSRLVKEKKDLPDLIIIDGGKGQLSSAIQALQDIDIHNQPIVSLAKKLEEVFIPGLKEPVIFDQNSFALFLFQQIRDEAHRFAVTFQRHLRGKRMLKSNLDGLANIGKKRKALLIKHFGTIDNLMKASEEDLAIVKGIGASLAKQIFSQLNVLNNN